MVGNNDLSQDGCSRGLEAKRAFRIYFEDKTCSIC